TSSMFDPPILCTGRNDLRMMGESRYLHLAFWSNADKRESARQKPNIYGPLQFPSRRRLDYSEVSPKHGRELGQVLRSTNANSITISMGSAPRSPFSQVLLAKPWRA